ncbi:hypothetical protein HPB50_017486 [Hyalomma asiaticum]|uniref:Uncharacterized protein n=1 Tax=Hyalomma asiaticum TaxID=266040 RepID=A0ACB7RMS8_HYAAI|nr:hypothetical protein HPB50_017486 [Hyalomma asiaticum]
MFSFCIRNGIVPDVVRRLFAGFVPSIGHITRQARLYRQLLAALLFDCGDALRASRRHQDLFGLLTVPLNSSGTYNWPIYGTKSSPHLEPLDLPPAVIRVLSLGPKFAVEPKRSPHELLSFVHHLSQHAPLGEHDAALLGRSFLSSVSGPSSKSET